MKNKILTLVFLTLGPLGLQTHSMVIFLVSRCKIVTDVLSTWRSPHTGSLTYETGPLC